jgi:hypothetical protein
MAQALAQVRRRKRRGRLVQSAVEAGEGVRALLPAADSDGPALGMLQIACSARTAFEARL